MLTELHIENFAIIDRLSLDFGPGLITFTGETGAGKSIIIDAVETILGGRAESTLVRADAERANLEAVFRIPAATREPVHAILEREALLDDQNFVTLAREVRLEGRNVARVNGRTVSVSLLRELGEYLIDVHGQSEHLSLLRVNQHQRLLDSYAANFQNSAGVPLEELLIDYRASYRELLSVQRELTTLRQAEQDATRRTDILNYQINEIEALRLKPDEEQDLREERNRLANAESLTSLAQEALVVLDEGTPDVPAVTDLLGQAAGSLSSLVRFDATQAETAEQAQVLLETISDLASNLRDYLENIEFNPKRLDQVEDRLAAIQGLKRKYGSSITDILAYCEKAQVELDQISHAEERIAELEAQQKKLLARLGQQGQAVSAVRQAAAEQLSNSIESELNDLRMAGARFTVAFERRPDPQGALLEDSSRVSFDANGLEKIEFLIAPNPGEGFKPLAKTASGGETSRLMLALKNVLAQADQVPTLIFDEIDQGIGGRVGTVVGQKLWNLGRQHQVLCITHLPQLAAFGDQHFQVQKQVVAGRTNTQVSPLRGEERVYELAQMLGDVNESTIRSARELIQSTGQRTTST